MQPLVPEQHRIARQHRKDRPHDAEHGGQVRRRVGVLDRGPERDIAKIEQEQDQERGQPRLPGPPGAPYRLPPDRPGEERDQRHRDPDRRRRLGGKRAHVMAPHEPDQRGDQHHDPDVDRHHRRRHMQIDDLHRRALPRIVGCQEKPPAEPRGKGEKRQHHDPGHDRCGRVDKALRIGIVPDRHGRHHSRPPARPQCRPAAPAQRRLTRSAAAAAKGRSAIPPAVIPPSISIATPASSPAAPRRTVSAPKISVGT